MKVVLLSDPASAHTIKWANGIHSKGVDVLVYGLTACDYSQYNSGIEIEIFISVPLPGRESISAFAPDIFALS